MVARPLVVSKNQSSWLTWQEIDLKKIEENAEQTTVPLCNISGIVHWSCNNQAKSPFTTDKTKYSPLTKLLRINAYRETQKQYWQPICQKK